MVKQTIQICRCKRPMDFPEGEVKATCLCGCVWELDLGGTWFNNLAMFTPRRKNRYERHMEWRRKAGKR